MNKLALLLGLLISQTPHAEIIDCYEKYGLTPPKSTNYIMLIDNHDFHSQDDKKKAEQWLSQLKSNDLVFIYNYSYGITPEINNVFAGRYPVGVKLVFNKEDKVEDKKFIEDNFSECININSLKWTTSQSRMILSAFENDQDETIDDTKIDNLKKVKLFTQFLIPQNKNNNKILWISKLKQQNEEVSLSEDDSYLNVDTQEILLNLPGGNAILDRSIKNTEIEIYNSIKLQGKQKEDFNKIKLFWEQYFSSLGISIINE